MTKEREGEGILTCNLLPKKFRNCLVQVVNKMLTERKIYINKNNFDAENFEL